MKLYYSPTHMQKEGLMDDVIADKIATAYRTSLRGNWKWKKLERRVIDIQPDAQEQLIQHILGDLERLGSYLK